MKKSLRSRLRCKATFFLSFPKGLMVSVLFPSFWQFKVCGDQENTLTFLCDKTEFSKSVNYKQILFVMLANHKRRSPKFTFQNTTPLMAVLSPSIGNSISIFSSKLVIFVDLMGEKMGKFLQSLEFRSDDELRNQIWKLLDHWLYVRTGLSEQPPAPIEFQTGSTH